MSRHRFIRFAVVVAALVAPSVSLAYFPPTIGMPPTVPPDVFKPPTSGGLGGQEPPPPGHTHQTPEPATLVTALTGVVLAIGYGVRKRRREAVAA